MADRKVERAKAEVRQKRDRGVWQDRIEAGRAARQAEAPRETQGMRDGHRERTGTRQRQTAGG